MQSMMHSEFHSGTAYIACLESRRIVQIRLSRGWSTCPDPVARAIPAGGSRSARRVSRGLSSAGPSATSTVSEQPNWVGQETALELRRPARLWGESPPASRLPETRPSGRTGAISSWATSAIRFACLRRSRASVACLAVWHVHLHFLIHFRSEQFVSRLCVSLEGRYSMIRS